MPTVGVIGLGKMGLPIASNLLERGFQVVGYCRHGSPELAAMGGTSVSSAAEAAAQADTIVSILPNVQAVQSVVLGPAGTLESMRAGVVHVEMSTIDVAEKRLIRDAVRARGGDMLDCPISGSPGMVRPRLTTAFASGDKGSVDGVTEVLDALSGRWVHTGEFGTGAWMKYISNLLLAVHTVAAAEALNLARLSGLDLELVQSTLNESIASSEIWRQRGPIMQRQTWTPAPGPIDTLQAILQQIEHHAMDVSISLPVFSSAKAVFDSAVADGRGDLDIAYVYDQIRHGETVRVAT